MKKILLFAFVFLIADYSFTQSFWQQLTSYPGTAVVNQMTDCAGKIFIGTNGNGILVSSDNGITLNASNTGISDLDIKSIGSKNDSMFFAGVKNRIVYISNDTGKTWNPVNMGGTGNIVTSFCLAPDGKVYSGQSSDGIFRTTDNGQTWLEVGLCCAGVLSCAANSSGIIYAGTNAGGVYRSTNGGTAWDDVNTGLSNLSVNVLALNNLDTLFAGTNGGVFRSINNGDNWTEVNYGLTNLSITDICIKHNGHIFVSTAAGGIFLSKDNGDNWTPVNTGLTSLNISCLAMDMTGFIYAGSLDSILFRSAVPYTHIQSIIQSKNTELKQNFPNPFTSSTTLEFYISKPSNVILKIYDITGKITETLVNGQIQEGIHRVIWDASGYNSGIYFGELKINEEFSKIIMNFVK